MIYHLGCIRIIRCPVDFSFITISFKFSAFELNKGHPYIIIPKTAAGIIQEKNISNWIFKGFCHFKYLAVWQTDKYLNNMKLNKEININ